MKLGFSQNVQFMSKRQDAKKPGLFDKPHRISHKTLPDLWAVGLPGSAFQENAREGCLSPSPCWSQPPVLLQAPWEEACFAHDLESNSACDRPRHLALKIEGALSPAFSQFTCGRYSDLSEVTLCYRDRRGLTGLS